MASKIMAVYGIYRDRAHVEDAVDALMDDGFRNEDMSVLMPESRGGRQKATEGETLGETLGLLPGIGARTIPGVGSFIAAGRIMDALAGAETGGPSGDIAGVLTGMGMPEHDARRYDGMIKDGGILFAVHADNTEWATRATEILEHTGAEHISSSGEAGAEGRPRVRYGGGSGM